MIHARRLVAIASLVLLAPLACSSTSEEASVATDDSLIAPGGSCPYGAGRYCGGGKAGGVEGRLYSCSGGRLALDNTCAHGCKIEAPGTDDHCKPAPPTSCPHGDGLYCGGNGVEGNANTLYRCASGALTPARVCASKCTRKPAGVDDACSSTADNVQRALAYGVSLVGTNYGWWYSGPIPTGAPMWSADGLAPAASTVRASSANCAGLTNLMLRSVGKSAPGAGGTGAYGSYYAGVAETFNINRSYPAGTLIGRYFRDARDQGHVAVILGNGRVLQSFAYVYGGAYPGVNTDYTVAESHDGGFYEYAVLPEHWLGD